MYKAAQDKSNYISQFPADLSCSRLSDLRDSEEVAKALKTAVGSKQVQITLRTLLRILTVEVLLTILDHKGIS